jgi:hypothetical protein
VEAAHGRASRKRLPHGSQPVAILPAEQGKSAVAAAAIAYSNFCGSR